MSDASRYLLAVYIVQRRGGAPVSSGRIAQSLGKSPSATTEMLQRLETRGLLVYEPYEGATLTAEGRDVAADLYESYVTLSRFFRDVLDIDEYEAEAMELAGSVSPVVTERLATTLLEDGGTRPVRSDPP